jgi:CO dehydrogenase maturation factor
VRIAVAGKGGAGKTTIAGTLARALADAGHEVLALDADPNPNLALTLGMDLAAYDDGRGLSHDVLEHREVDGKRVAVLAHPLDDLLGTYAQQAPAGIRLLRLGQPQRAGAG